MEWGETQTETARQHKFTILSLPPSLSLSVIVLAPSETYFVDLHAFASRVLGQKYVPLHPELCFLNSKLARPLHPT